MAFKDYVLKGVLHVNGYDANTQTIDYSMAVINRRSGSLLWRATDLKHKTVSRGRKALINMNEVARRLIWDELNLPKSTKIRVEVANTAEALKMLPKEKVVVKAETAKIEKMELSNTDKKYAVICKNGVWTIEKFDVPHLVTKEEALEILLSKICK